MKENSPRFPSPRKGLVALTLTTLSTILIYMILSFDFVDKKEHVYTLNFTAKFGDQLAQCGKMYKDLGVCKTNAELKDLRFYISNIKLIKNDSVRVDAQLFVKDNWQNEHVALLDFENAKGQCSEKGTGQTNNKVFVRAPKGNYTGIVFNLGVPNKVNHKNNVSAPSPLNMGAMYWSWQGGYKFLRLELASQLPKPYDVWFLHLGSVACQSPVMTMAPKHPCERPNLPEISLTNFDINEDVVVADIAMLLEGVDVSYSLPMPPGCMSGTNDPDCPLVLGNLGLDPLTGNCIDGCANQKFFRIDKAAKDLALVKNEDYDTAK